jgi:hypothetical protein
MNTGQPGLARKFSPSMCSRMKAVTLTADHHSRAD